MDSKSPYPTPRDIPVRTITKPPAKTTVARSPTIQILSSSEKMIRFTMSGTENDPALPNALRLAMLNDVPTLAIYQIVVHTNSGLPDPVLAHALGMIVWKCKTLRDFHYPLECVHSGGCDKCQVLMEIDYTNTTTIPQPVTTAHIKCADPDIVACEIDELQKWNSQDKWMKPQLSVLAHVAPKQALKVMMYACKGNGSQHARWIPISPHGAFNYHFNVAIDPSTPISEKDQKAIVSACPRKVLSLSNTQHDLVSAMASMDIKKVNRTHKIAIEDTAAMDRCTGCQLCVVEAEHCGLPDMIRVEQRYDYFRFTVVSTGARTAREIVQEGLAACRSRLQNAYEQVSTLPL